MLNNRPLSKANKIKINEIALCNSTLTGYEYKYNNPIIPTGFKAVNSGASWNVIGNEIEGWNNGLVIEDEKGNQFVWVPVKDGVENDGKYENNDDISYKIWCMYEENKQAVIGKKAEVIVPDNLEDDTLPQGINSETEQIEKYGGFYIGRYETGIEEEEFKDLYNLNDDYNFVTTDSRNNQAISTPIIKENSNMWNLISYNNAKVVCEKMYNNENVQSGMMTDKQFDTIMRWAKVTGYNLEDGTTFGNYFDTKKVDYTGKYISYLKGRKVDWKMEGYGMKDKNEIVITSPGGVKQAKINEIYDIAGNLFEFVSKLSKGEDVALDRGGGASYSGIKGSPYPPTSYSGWSKDSIHYIIGFRIILYIK